MEDALFAGGIVMFVFAIIGFTFLLVIGMYIITAIPLYKMAKKMGKDNAWLAWIPIGNQYIMYTIPDKPYDLFNGKIHFEERYKAFIMSLVVSYGGSIIYGMFSGLSVIPILGVFMFILAWLIWFAAIVCAYIIQYPMYKDIYDTFIPSKDNTALAVISIIIPIVAIVMLWIASSKEPVRYTEPTNYN